MYQTAGSAWQRRSLASAIIRYSPDRGRIGPPALPNAGRSGKVGLCPPPTLITFHRENSVRFVA